MESTTAIDYFLLNMGVAPPGDAGHLVCLQGCLYYLKIAVALAVAGD
jgi:hypothetical protein